MAIQLIYRVRKERLFLGLRAFFLFIWK